MASSHGAEPREVAFAIQPQQQYAFHLRLTPQLLESLIRSQEHAEPISIQFGDAPSENVSRPYCILISYRNSRRHKGY